MFIDGHFYNRIYEAGSENNTAVVAVETHTIHKIEEGIGKFFVVLVLFFFFFFLRTQPRHMEVPRLGVELELQLTAYTTPTATQDPSHVCDLYPQLMVMPDP